VGGGGSLTDNPLILSMKRPLRGGLSVFLVFSCIHVHTTVGSKHVRVIVLQYRSVVV